MIQPRSVWQPILLAELRRIGKLSIARQLAGVDRATVRRYEVMDAQRMGHGAPGTLRWQIDAAIEHYACMRLARRRSERIRSEAAREENSVSGLTLQSVRDKKRRATG